MRFTILLGNMHRVDFTRFIDKERDEFTVFRMGILYDLVETILFQGQFKLRRFFFNVLGEIAVLRGQSK